MSRTVLADEVPPVPWKNGGGLTRDLAGDGTPGVDDWRWRISLADVSAVTTEPGRLVGLGFFDPVHATPQVQVTIGPATSRTTVERVVGLVNALGKSPILHGAPRAPG